MRKLHFQFSIVTLCSVTVAVLAVVYVGLIAAVMSYATLTIEFSHSVKNTEAEVAMLDAQYLANVSRIESLDYHSVGYALPSVKIFVPSERMTALR